MTQTDLLQLLRDKCEQHSQAEVARRLGYSGAAISQVLSGTYGGDSYTILTKVEEIYGNTVVNCPILGDIPLSKCAELRKRPFAATNPTRVALYRACRNCKHNQGR